MRTIRSNIYSTWVDSGAGIKDFFWCRASVKNPDKLDIFKQRIAVTVFGALASLWGHGQQHFRFR